MSGAARGSVLCGCVLSLAVVGCAGGGAERAGSAVPASQTAERSELSGTWSEYWSRAGQADSQRYTFSDNGEFRWSAAPSVSAPQAGTPLQKQGKFELHRTPERRWLVLHVAATDLAGCDSACEGEDRAFHVEHSPALLQELELGECPPNAEAQQLDAHYACLALGDQAFWRGPSAQSP